jgi:hypothetical protein
MFRNPTGTKLINWERSLADAASGSSEGKFTSFRTRRTCLDYKRLEQMWHDLMGSGLYPGLKLKEARHTPVMHHTKQYNTCR